MIQNDAIAKRNHRISTPAPDTPKGVNPSKAAIHTEEIVYEHGGRKFKGYLAYNASLKGKRPGVLIFHEWWGLNANAKGRAERLAELGYVAWAADVYGEGIVIDLSRSDDAAEMAAMLRANTKLWRGRTKAALEQLTLRPNVDASKIAAIGYCLESALQLAIAGANLKAVATFHSVLPVPTVAEARAIKGKVLALRGGADPFIPNRAVENFRAVFDAVGSKLEVISYDGVAHSFTSPEADKVGNPALKYDKHADEDSWNRMRELFASVFIAEEASS